MGALELGYTRVLCDQISFGISSVQEIHCSAPSPTQSLLIGIHKFQSFIPIINLLWKKKVCVLHLLTLLFYSICLSVKNTLRYLVDIVDKEDVTAMILWRVQKFVTKGVTQLSEKHFGVTKPHIENALVIFGVRSHRLPILKNASLPSRIWVKRFPQNSTSFVIFYLDFSLCVVVLKHLELQRSIFEALRGVITYTHMSLSSELCIMAWIKCAY